MKKSSKQKKSSQKNQQRQHKHQQAKTQQLEQRKLDIQAKLNEQLAQTAADMAQNGIAPNDIAVGGKGLEILGATTAAERQAALLAHSQRTQWKQQLKAGKMAGAQVGKRFNRGG